jgi:hypothetical protein
VSVDTWAALTVGVLAGLFLQSGIRLLNLSLPRSPVLREDDDPEYDRSSVRIFGSVCLVLGAITIVGIFLAPVRAPPLAVAAGTAISTASLQIAGWMWSSPRRRVLRLSTVTAAIAAIIAIVVPATLLTSGTAPFPRAEPSVTDGNLASAITAIMITSPTQQIQCTGSTACQF